MRSRSEPVITAITLAELSVGPLTAMDPAERAARQIRLQETEATFEPLPFDAAPPAPSVSSPPALRQSGRKVASRAFDAMIAAVALANDLPVYTCNPRDFAGIDGLRVHAIRHPDHPVTPPETGAGAVTGRRLAQLADIPVAELTGVGAEEGRRAGGHGASTPSSTCSPTTPAATSTAPGRPTSPT